MSAYLNSTVENCSSKDTIVSLKKANTYRKTTCRVGNSTQLKLWSLHQICVPWEGAVLSAGSLLPAVPPSLVCLSALSLLEIYSRNRRTKTYLNSRGGEQISCLIVAVDHEGNGHRVAY